MKKKVRDLDVDFIGGQGPLTKDEEEKISEYLRSQKQVKEKSVRGVAKTSNGKKKMSA